MLCALSPVCAPLKPTEQRLCGPPPALHTPDSTVPTLHTASRLQSFELQEDCGVGACKGSHSTEIRSMTKGHSYLYICDVRLCVKRPNVSPQVLAARFLTVSFIGWLGTPHAPPVSISPTLGLRAHTTTFGSYTYMVSGA